MGRIHTSVVIDAPIERAWSVVRDFGGIADWIPGVLKCRIEGGAPSDQVGCVRAVNMADGMSLRVPLLALSDVDHSQTYSPIPPEGSPYRRIVCTISLKNITASGQTYAELDAQFEGAPGIDLNPILTAQRKNYAGMMAGLKKFVEQKRVSAGG